MSFKYKLNPKVCGLRPVSAYQEDLLSATELSNVTPHRSNGTNDHGIQNLFVQSASELIQYPIFALPKPTLKRQKKVSIVSTAESYGKVEPVNVTDDETDHAGGEQKHLKIKVELDFGRFFAWLERAMWLVMSIGIVWALIIDYNKATLEVCTKGGDMEAYPFNVLPSLSRTMSSFRVGTFLWTIVIALAFVARLASNSFLHKLYETWYEPTCWNKFCLIVSYYADNVEIVSLLMIPAFSLDCDWEAHRFFFILFLVLTYTAEVLQYFTRFLRRRKGVIFNEDVENYYKHIGILILLQTFFIVWMLGGYFLHEYVCINYLYSIFTFGEYMTVVINLRFKRDTVIFVK